MKRSIYPRLIIILLLCNCKVYAQSDSADITKNMLNVNDKMLDVIQRKYSSIEKGLSSQSKKYLARLQKKEASIYKIISKKDSSAANRIANEAKNNYSKLMLDIKNISTKIDKSQFKAYIPGLDSVNSTFQFLEKSGLSFSGLSPEKIAQFKAISAQIKNVQGALQAGANIRQFLKSREGQLKAELDKYGLGQKIKGFNKQAYYYQQQFNEYKAMITDQKKMEQQLLILVRNIPSFKKFMEQNSQLSQMFRMPSSNGTQPVPPGLQSRSGIESDLGGRLGSGTGSQQFMNQQAQMAQAELAKLKDKINKLGGSSSDMIIPDFQPNKQRTKSFLKRIEIGLNFQSQSAGIVLPATSDITLTAGYKLNDKSTIGLGAGYKLGLGRGFNNIRFSSQGLSLRSFLDIKLKGSFWISGGYEENYFHEFSNINQLKDRSAWQESGLIGLMKKYKLAKKEGNLQLLWDFLSYRQLPRAVPLKFRIGYVF